MLAVDQRNNTNQIIQRAKIALFDESEDQQLYMPIIAENQDHVDCHYYSGRMQGWISDTDKSLEAVR